MVELVVGRKYKIVSTAPGDFFENKFNGFVGKFTKETPHCVYFTFAGYKDPIDLLKGLELEELPPIENEAATMEMMGFSDKEVASYMQNNKIGFIGFSTPPEKINPTTAEKITKVSFSLNDLLLYKNARYGDTGLNPVRIFSKSDADTGLLQRLDDKISRIQNSPEPRKNDVADLMGYLTLLCVSKGWDNFDEFKD